MPTPVEIVTSGRVREVLGRRRRGRSRVIHVIDGHVRRRPPGPRHGGEGGHRFASWSVGLPFVSAARGRLPVAGGLRSMAGELLVRGFRQLVALCFGAVLIALLASVPTAVSSGRRVSRHMILIQPDQSLGGVPTTGIAPAVA